MSQGISTLHDWEHRLREILLDMLDALEREKDFGYFDCIIDIGTDVEIIGLLRQKYLDQHNMRYELSQGRDYIPKFKIPEEELKKQFKGGYTEALKTRLINLLVKGET